MNLRLKICSNHMFNIIVVWIQRKALALIVIFYSLFVYRNADARYK